MGDLKAPGALAMKVLGVSSHLVRKREPAPPSKLVNAQAEQEFHVTADRIEGSWACLPQP
jgi:hypothetical protein